MGMREIKDNSGHPLLSRGRRVADMIDRDCVTAAALPYLIISSAILIRIHVWLIYMGFRCWSEVAAKWLDECGAQPAKGFSGASARPSESCRRLWFLSFVCRTEHFARNYQGVSHAKWPKAKHECAATQTGSVTCCPLKAVDIECPPPRAHRPSKRAKKLRAVSGARPR